MDSRRGCQSRWARKFLRQARAVIIFIHGWDGSGAIWENLPAHVCAAENDCLILVPDVNGFGGSPFAHPERLTPDQCSPQANMRALEKWLSTLKLLGSRREYPTVFVGHSMGGATLFYLNERLWSGRTVGRYAVAPALLLNDLTKKSFYRTLGAGIFAGNLLSLDKLQNQFAPFVINQLIAGASKAVQAEHKRIFKKTHKQTIARTFDAMGQAKKPSHGREWNRFRVILGSSGSFSRRLTDARSTRLTRLHLAPSARGVGRSLFLLGQQTEPAVTCREPRDHVRRYKRVGGGEC